VTEIPNTESSSLRRQLGLAALIFYGVGDILGAGIYALVGEIAAVAGRYSWLAFVIALVVASFTGLTYAELGSRYPRSGGESHFCSQAFRQRWIARVIGWTVFCSGVVSLATISRAFAGYLHGVAPDLPAQALVLALLLVLAIVNWIGIRISSAANIVFTLIEASGLLFIVCIGIAWIVGDPPAGTSTATEAASVPQVGFMAIMQAASLAFFAFIGFEDLVNVAEEAKNPRRDMPIAIVLSAAIAGTLYVVVILAATHVVAPAELAASPAPLMSVVDSAAPWFPRWVFTGIALFAVANTGLLNFITASRLLYGMSRDRLLPAFLGRIDERRKTPHYAIMIVFAAAALLAITGSLRYLAGTTSVLLLIVFTAMNVVLIRLKRSHQFCAEAFSVPLAIPVCGVAVCVALLCSTPWPHVVSAIALMAVGSLLTLSDITAHDTESF